MSDRKEPHIQVVHTGSGSTYHSSSTKRSTTLCRPGALSPGGTGVDIKHNSYDRYLNRLKGKGPLRRGPVPKIIESPYIPFNRAYPIYGDKVMKMSIVNNCDCPDTGRNESLKKIFLKNDFQDEIYKVTYEFQVGQIVLAYKNGSTTKSQAVILSILDNVYTIEFLDDNAVEEKSKGDLTIYQEIPSCTPVPQTIPIYDPTATTQSTTNQLLCTKLAIDYVFQ